MRRFRFGCNVRTIRSRDALRRTCRDAERRGYDVLLIPDHLGRNRPAPFPMIVAIADATDRVRVGPFVLNVAFWNPSMLARETATTDQLTDGRLELGLGAGHMKSEFDAAGIPWQLFTDRVDRLAATIDELDGLFADEQVGYDTLQRPRPPLMIAGTGDRTLQLAAERADIVGYTGVLQAKGEPPGTFRIATAAEMDERVRFFGEQAGARADEVEANILVQRVVVTDRSRPHGRRGPGGAGLARRHGAADRRAGRRAPRAVRVLVRLRPRAMSGRVRSRHRGAARIGTSACHPHEGEPALVVTDLRR